MGFVKNSNAFVFLDIKVGQENVSRIVIELFPNIVPKTVENFRALCTGEKGYGKQGKPLHFKGCNFHKAVPGFMVQGGDIINFDGTGGESIYGLHFEDEHFLLRHENEGDVSMANCGVPNSNSSQFFITTVPCPHLDETNVVFGRVKFGLGVIREISLTPAENEKPLLDCVIENCGEIVPEEGWGINERDGTEDIFPPFPEDWMETDKEKIHKDTTVAKIKESGNSYFKKENYIVANQKYKKALRYIDWFMTTVAANSSEEEALKNLNASCLLNSAAAFLKLKNYKLALAVCDNVLSIDNNNPKALFRKAQANKNLNNYELALTDLNIAVSLQPNDALILNEIRIVKRYLQEYSLQEKKRYSKILKTD